MKDYKNTVYSRILELLGPNLYTNSNALGYKKNTKPDNKACPGTLVPIRNV